MKKKVFLVSGSLTRFLSRTAKILPRAASALCLAGLSSLASAQESDWEFSVTPYLWMIGTELDTRIDLPVDGQQSFSDILGKLDFAAQIHAEAHRGRLGFMLDVTNLQLSDEVDRDLLRIGTDSNTTVVEAAMLWKVAVSEAGSASLMVGTRVIDVDLDVSVFGQPRDQSLAQRSLGGTLTDFMVGVRGERRLSDKWTMRGRADVAGGDTNFSRNVSLVAGRSIGESGELQLGYRYLDVDFESDGGLISPTLAITGPLIGYTFNW